MKAEVFANILYPGNFFATVIINALKLTLKLTEVNQLQKKFQILLKLCGGSPEEEGTDNTLLSWWGKIARGGE